MEEYLQLTEEANAMDYLVKTGKYIADTSSDPMAWKWVLLSLHSALYGFAICLLRTEKQEVITYSTKNNKWQNILDFGYIVFRSKKNQKTLETNDIQLKLIDYIKAIKQCQNKKNFKNNNSYKYLVLSDSQETSIDKLNHVYRNNIVHYIPKEWVLLLYPLPQIAVDILEVIDTIVTKCTNCTMLNTEQYKEFKSIITESIVLLKSSKLYIEYDIISKTKI